MVAEVQVFNNNAIYVYFLSCIAIFSYQHFSKRQKVSLIYATTVAMELISQYSWKLTAFMLFIAMFILEEYLSDDIVKCELLSNIWYKMVDFIYQFIFMDAGIWIIINMVISGKDVRNFFVQKGLPIVLFYGGNITILLLSMHMVNTSKFGLYDFGVIKKYFDNFNGRKIKWDSKELQRRFDIMVALEDKSYFERERSYNWLSLEFVQYKIRTYKEKREWEKQYTDKKSFCQMFRTIWYLIKNFKLIRYSIERIKEHILESKWSMEEFFYRLRRKFRGCSTLEMQLIRNIGIEKGYDKCVIRRKFFEFFYTYLFFNGLKKYYESTQNNKRKEFKRFILYVYLHSIKLNMFGNEFSTINKLFEQEEVEKWDIDEFYIAILSLTGAPVTPRRMALYSQVITSIGIDLNRALLWRDMIKDFRITEAQKENINETEVKRVFYIVEGQILPYMEEGVFYGPNDGKDDWPSYGEQRCWSFARVVYWHIWCENFTNKTGTEDDMMRDYHSLAERVITPEHCQKYLGSARPGAVIRICDDIKGNDRKGKNKHSQILLSHDETGITIYESNEEHTSIEYYTWNQYAEKYGKYRYFKYIKWPTYIC